MKKSLLILLALLLYVGAMAQSELYPKRTIDGKEFYLYTVEKGDGFWGVSKKFGITQAELHQYNPTISEGLQLGQTLTIPVRLDVYKTEQKVVASTTTFTSTKQHVVEKGQTVYAICRMYNITADDLASVNSDIAQNLQLGKINVGDVLNIPLKGESQPSKIATSATTDTVPYVLHEVKKKETLYSISRQYNVEINEILEHNDIGTELKKGQLLRIYTKSANVSLPAVPINEPKTAVTEAELLPQANEVEAQSSTTPPSHNALLRVAVLMPFKLNASGADRTAEKFVDLYRGVLLAANSLKSKGLSTDIYAYDTSNTLAVIDSILQLPEMKQMDLIIGPAYSSQVARVAEFAHQNKIYTVVPLSQNVTDLENNPFIFQFHPSVAVIQKIAISQMLERLTDKKFLIAYVENCTDNGNKFAEAFQTELIHRNIDYTTHVVNISSIDSIAKVAIAENAVMLLASNNSDRVRPLLKTIRSQVTPISLIGFEDWGLPLLKANKPIIYYALFTEDSELKAVYDTIYGSYFGAVNASYPAYDKIGYDIANTLLQTLQNAENRKSISAVVPTQGLQTTIDFVQVLPNGGWMNQNLYINQIR